MQIKKMKRHEEKADLFHMLQTEPKTHLPELKMFLKQVSGN